MRAYFFGNLYLSSIQQGLQSAHVLAEMYTKYVGPDPYSQYFVLDEWAREHKTIIILNAGYSEEIRFLSERFATQEKYPWASFNEGQDALDGALTCIGIVLPEHVYEGSAKIRELGKGETISHWNTGLTNEFDLWMANQMTNYSLAR